MFHPDAIPKNRENFPKPRKSLSLDALIDRLRWRAGLLVDPRGSRADIPLADAFMSAFAMFSLKEPSLLAFDKRRHDQNMRNLFRIDRVPSDTQMREILDLIEPDHLRPFFNDIFRELQRGKVLESFLFREGSYLLSLDGTGYFSSDKIHCETCLSKTDKSGKTTYHHQMLGAALVHPGRKEVIPMAPEPIVKQDGSNKNDCERNAAKRLLHKIRLEHPHFVADCGRGCFGEQRAAYPSTDGPGHAFYFGRETR